ncbi:Protein CBG09549 [Caenorhabditis briggsae]|uniref:Protein CBG09549 n=1 Tax=Caenorhabditis briggsae TaxID=6238 RepID=A8X8U4_CAEBR|nr:Protein CBG09549 [Caenorhabditis briggsae]CAP29055.1 Protein CBG09549 [Caenorhabditis briggsae]
MLEYESDVVTENSSMSYYLELQDIQYFIDIENCVIIFYIVFSIILSIVLKWKCKVFESSNHFTLIFYFCTAVVILGSLLYTVTTFTLLYFKSIRHIFLIMFLFIQMALKFCAPFISPVITTMTFLYSFSFVFQRTETLKTAFQSKTGSRTIWIISSVYGLWVHPFNSHNKSVLYYDTNHYLYQLISINLFDCFIILCTTILVGIKLLNVYKHPKHLSNYEIASLIHVTVILFFQHILFIFNLVMLNSSNVERLESLKNVLMEKRGTWQIFCIFGPFSYPYSILSKVYGDNEDNDVEAEEYTDIRFIRERDHTHSPSAKMNCEREKGDWGRSKSACVSFYSFLLIILFIKHSNSSNSSRGGDLLSLQRLDVRSFIASSSPITHLPQTLSRDVADIQI